MKSVSESSSLPAVTGAFGRMGRPFPSVAATPARDDSAADHVYEVAPLAYLNFDSHGRILNFNLAASRLLGIERPYEIHRPLADFISPRHHRRLREHVERSRESCVPVVTRLKLRGRDGAGAKMEMSTRPAIDSTCYRTHLTPLSGDNPVAWPMDEAKFRGLVENSSEVICIGAPDGTVFYTTPSVRRVLGYEPASWFGRNAFDIMPPEQAALARLALLQLAAKPTGSVMRLATQVRHANGSWKWVEAVLTNLIGEPAIGAIVCNYRDITDSRQAEESLRASEERYRLLAESLPSMVCVRDKAGRVLFCNQHWCDYRGTTREEASTFDWTAGIPKEDLEALTPPPWVTGEPRQWECECRCRRASDGMHRWHLVRVFPLPEKADSRARYLAIATDIHERKQAEQERERLLAQIERERLDLATQYAMVRVLAGSSGIEEAAPRLLAAFCHHLHWEAGALWTLDARGRLSLIQTHQTAGLAPADLLARNRPGPIKRGQGLAGRVWKQKQPASLARLAANRGAAHYRAAARLGLRRALAFPIVLRGEVQGVVELFTRDSFEPGDRLLKIVTSVGIQIGLFMQRTQALDQLRQSEEALIQVNNALERRVSARTAELHTANRELSAEIAERTRLEREIIRISEREQRRIGQDLHDGVCQELTAIAFITRALANRVGKISPDATPRINRVARLINDSLSRCRDIARGLHPVEMDADGLMVALKDLAARTHKTIPCSFQCKRPIPMPESDTALNLYRIAQEAVNNALKYSKARRVTINLGRQGRALRLSIADDGCGIPPAGARARRGGMGLHIMRYRARSMGATLRVLDRQPRGTEVVCLLPRP